MEEERWYALEPKEVMEKLGTSENGLSEDEARRRLKEFGYNELKKRKKLSAFQIFLNQFKDIFVIILLIAILISVLIGWYKAKENPQKSLFEAYAETIAIGAIVLLNAIVGFTQEYRAEKALEAMKKLTTPKAKVIRSGKEVLIDAREVVPGDILLIEAGDRIAADGLLFESIELEVNEAVLTGESTPVRKKVGKLNLDVPITKRENCVFMATYATYGRGKAIVTATGMKTEFGKIAEKIQEIEEEETPLKRKLNDFAKKLGKFVIISCAIIFVLELYEILGIFGIRELERIVKESLDAFMIAVALAVSAVPEGLPAIVTITLALGARELAKRNAIIRRLSSAETLGAVTTICVPGDTPIICNSSIKRIDSIKEGDRVLGIDGNFHEVIKTYKRNYKGKIVRIKPVGFPWLTITPEHPILVARIKRSRPVFNQSRPRKVEILGISWINAEEIKEGDMLLIPRIKNETRYVLSFRRGRKREKVEVEIDEELAELFGWYLAEGCTSIQKGKYSVIFYLGKNETENIERIKSLIQKKLELKSYVYENPTSVSIVVINQDLAYFFRNSFGENANCKRIPDFILYSPKNILSKFLYGYLKGDGRIDDYYIRFSTVSHTLAYQLIILLAKLGIRARLHRRKGGISFIEGRKVKVSESYEIFISGTQADIIHPVKRSIRERKKNMFLLDENFVFVPVRCVVKENASLDVFNIETSSQTYSLPFVVHNCSDKTGTLTKGEMTVKKIYVNDKIVEVTGVGYEAKGEFLAEGKSFDPKNIELLLRIGCLCNNASYDGKSIKGDPTEGALIVVAAKAGIKKEELENRYKRIHEIPFSSERKRMVTVHEYENKKFAYMKGAPEVILERCEFILKEGKIEKLDEKEKERILKINEEFASQALRVLGFAFKELPEKFDDENAEKGLVFVGLMGMIDPAREEAKEANKKCQEAGIKTIMITGDHKLTAIAIAKEIGMLDNNEEAKVLTGEELDKLSDEEFEKIVEDIRIYARVSPEHKLRIVKALKKKGHIVAMTGDGVNDAPALKQADIGIAMGITGTEVTKEASDMILADDNFATIVKAVEGGRGIYDNIRKFVFFLLRCNFGELGIVGTFALLGLPLPLNASMILWINLVTDGPPAIALSTDPPEEDLMKRKPRDPKQGVLYGRFAQILASILIQFFGAAFVFLTTYYTNWFVPFDVSAEYRLAKAMTMTFAYVSFHQLFVVFNCRSERKSVFKYSPFTNKYLVMAVIISFILTLMVCYIPIFQTMFGTVSLTLQDLALVLTVSSLGLFILPEVFYGRRIWKWV